MRANFNYYLKSRKIDKNFEFLLNLILSDKIKPGLRCDTRERVREHEGVDSLMTPGDLALFVDTYEVDKPYQKDEKNESSSATGKTFVPWVRSVKTGKSDKAPIKRSSSQNHISSNNLEFTCHNCHEAGHRFYKCPKPLSAELLAKQKAYKASVSVLVGSEQAASSPSDKCTRHTVPVNHTAAECKSNLSKQTSHKVLRVVVEETTDDLFIDNVLSHFNLKHLTDVGDVKTLVISQCDNKKNVLPTLHSSNANHVYIDFGLGPKDFILDTGSDLTIIRPEYLTDNYQTNKIGTAKLQSAFGQLVEATVVECPARLLSPDNEFDLPFVSITCAVTDQLQQPTGLLSLHDYELLLNSERVFKVNACTRSSKKHNSSVAVDSPKQHIMKAVDSIDVALLKLTDEYRLLQKNDVTLSECWRDLTSDNTSYIIKESNKLLYHKYELNGELRLQLVVPIDKRDEVIRLAHDSLWSGHFGKQKTLLRVEVEFFWPTMKHDISCSVSLCVPCQRKTRVTKYDWVPITPVIRPASSFEAVNLDVTGPLSPKSGRGHCYMPYRRLHTLGGSMSPQNNTAKETCDALLNIFNRIGIPKVVISDNGTNFVAGLPLNCTNA